MNSKAFRAACYIPMKMLLIFVVLVLPLTAGAQSWIVGGSVGAAAQQDYDIGAPIANADDVDTAFGVFGGYVISENQRVVASFFDLGTPSYNGPALGGFADSLDADGFDTSYVVGWAPGEQQRISIFGTIGVFSWDQDVLLTDASGTYQYHDEGTSFSVGFGAEFNLSADGSNAWAIQAAYKLFKDVGDADNSGIELDREMLTVGIAWRFGD